MTPEQLARMIAAGVPETVREVPTLRALEARTDDVDNDARTVVSIISNADIDRYRTIIVPKGARLDNFRANPVVLFNHDACSAPIGRALWVKYRKSKNDLIAKTRFDTDPFSDEIFTKYREGSLSAWSIRFDPDYTKSGPPTEDEIKADKRLKEVWYVYRAWELLEYSGVTLPGNAGCLTIPDERSLKLLPEIRAYLQALGGGDERRSDDPPPVPPTPADPPALPSLRGARTYAQVHADLVAPIRNARLKDAATRALDDAIGRARGRI